MGIFQSNVAVLKKKKVNEKTSQRLELFKGECLEGLMSLYDKLHLLYEGGNREDTGIFRADLGTYIDLRKSIEDKLLSDYFIKMPSTEVLLKNWREYSSKKCSSCKESSGFGAYLSQDKVVCAYGPLKENDEDVCDFYIKNER